MSQSYSFTFKVTQLPSKHHNHSPETAINNTRKMAFMAMLRAMAMNPAYYRDMEDGQFVDFKDEKASENGPVVYRITCHRIKL